MYYQPVHTKEIEMNETTTEKLFEFYMVSPRGKRISPINFLRESELGLLDTFTPESTDPGKELAATHGTTRRWVAVPR